MARSRSESLLVTVYEDGSRRRRPDELVVEEPMTIQLDGNIVSTTMRTPGNDYELAAGFCFSDGLLGGARVKGVRYCADGAASESQFNVVTVETGGKAPVPTPRLGTTTSSCGLCGNDSIEALCDRLEMLPATPPIAIDVLAAMPEAVLSGQGLFSTTGAVHAAAAFTPAGDVLATREDVGRHNAVDKIVGRMLLDDQLPATGLGLFVSGRASFELVQKAWAAGFGTLVAVSAPTALAVQTARRAGLTLAGFVRGNRVNVYAPERMQP
ncbi:MAG: formate dehydrogenase accessory sulfurtransferase FdhD [Ilumatobacteraceae bacterium]|nr:formate dehydrogenase accessory sulfurtransferase FdhD [Ilumatobacteraceae bacterium]